jgi:hypothetical protein
VSPIVLVYQVGRVGSSTIAASLARLGLTVHQVHRLNPENIARVREEHRRHGWPAPPGDALGQEVYERIVRRRTPARIVTLVREPIGRNISYYFQNLHKIWNDGRAHANVPLEALVRAFPVEYSFSDDPLTWFDYEFRSMLDVDVYRRPFDPAQGSLEVSSGVYDVLILRTDLADAAKSAALGRFLGVADVPLVPANVTADKPHGAIYRRFLDAIRMVPQYVEHMLGSRFARHFFDESSLRGLRERYLDGGTIVPDAFRQRWMTAD